MDRWPDSTYPPSLTSYPVQNLKTQQGTGLYPIPYGWASQEPYLQNPVPYPPTDSYPPPPAQRQDRGPPYPRDPAPTQYSSFYNSTTAEQTPPPYPDYNYHQSDSRSCSRDPRQDQRQDPKREFDKYIADQERYPRDPRGTHQHKYDPDYNKRPPLYPPQGLDRDQPWADDRYDSRKGASISDTRSNYERHPTQQNPSPPLGGRRPRLNEYFVNGTGISHEVIEMYTTRFLGLEASTRPSAYRVRSLALDSSSKYSVLTHQRLGPPRLYGYGTSPFHRGKLRIKHGQAECYC